MRRLRVCHVITQLELGGAQQNTLYTVRHLDRRHFEPQLVTGPDGLLDAEARSIDELAVECSPRLVRAPSVADDAATLVDLVSRFRRLRPDVIHTHSSKAGILGRAAATLAGVPIVVHTVHGWGFTPTQAPVVRSAFVAAERFAASMTTQLVTVSRANAEMGAARRIGDLGRYAVIHSGVQLERFAAASRSGALRAEIGIAADVCLVGMVACLKPQKAPLDFVRVCARVASEHADVAFVVAGDGVLRDDVERAVRDEGLEGRMHLLGWRRDTDVVIGDLDVLVLTSLHEGLPRVVPEAMAAGVPVVATAVDGTPEAVSHGETGFLRRPGDVAGLAADVARLVADPTLRRRMGAVARTRTKPWDIDEMVRDQERLYLRLAREAGLGAAVAA